MKIVRYMTQPGIEMLMDGDEHLPIYVDGNNGSNIEVTIEIPDPPKPLEIEGLWCDMKTENSVRCRNKIGCSPSRQEKESCRPVTLVEKGVCKCESQ